MDLLRPFAGIGSYVNDVAESGAEVVPAIYGREKHKRLIGLKKRWDPDNMFRMNQNIRLAE